MPLSLPKGKEHAWHPHVHGFSLSKSVAHTGEYSLAIDPIDSQQGAFQHAASSIPSHLKSVTLSAWFLTKNHLQTFKNNPSVHLEITYEDGYHASEILSFQDIPANQNGEWVHRCLAIEREYIIKSVTVFVITTKEGSSSREISYFDDISLLVGKHDVMFGSRCNSVDMMGKVERYDDYETKPFYFASEQDEAKESFSIATQLTVDRLKALERMAESWLGPISVAVGVRDINKDVAAIEQMRSTSTAVREWVDFHFVYLQPGQQYPINFLRNVAMENCITPHVIHLDVDFTTNKNMKASLTQRKDTIAQMQSGMDRVVFVIAAFEMDEGLPFPETKPDLLKMIENGQALPVHINIHKLAHNATDYPQWYRANDLYPVSHFIREYEPYVMTQTSVPPFDNRFQGYGHDKATFLLELHMANYQFMVLPDVWIVHYNHGTPSWKGKADEVKIWKNWYDFVATKQDTYRFPMKRYEIIELPEEVPILEDHTVNIIKWALFMLGLLILRTIFVNYMRNNPRFLSKNTALPYYKDK